MPTAPMSKPVREPLTLERVLSAAVELADASGIGALTMRSLAEVVGVKPMSLYHHVANKEQILDGLVDVAFAEIALPAATGDWRKEMYRRASSAREVLGRHPWAIGLLESRSTPGPATLRHHNAVLATLREGRFSVPMAAHAYALLDSYIYGFALQEATLALPRPESSESMVSSESMASMAEAANAFLEQMPPGEYPYLVEMATEHVMQPGYEFGHEFDFGLNVILDALAKLRRNPKRV
jgi:AcrR family transcriptional regulator